MLKKNLPAIAIFAGLLLIAAIYYFTNHSNTFAKNEVEFSLTNTSLITSISIKNNFNSFTLNKINGTWNYNSSFNVKPSLMDLCLRIISQVEIKSTVTKKTSSELSVKLKQSGTEIKLFNNKKILKHYLIYADTLEKETYMMMAEKAIPFTVTLPSFHGNFAALFILESKYWRDLSIFNYAPGQIASIKVEQSANPGQSFQLDITSGRKAVLTALKSGKVQSFRPEAVEAYLFCFRKVNATAYVDNNSEIITQLKTTKPLFKLTVIDLQDNVKTIKIFQKELEDFSKNKTGKNIDFNFCYIIINDKDLVLAKYVELDPITRELDFFLSK